MKIQRMNKGEWGKIKAFFDVETEEGFVMKGFKLVQGINGLFVGFPSQKGSDEEYYDTIYAEKMLREELSQLAIDFYGQEVMPTNELTDNKSNNENVSNSAEMNQPTESFTDDDIPF